MEINEKVLLKEIEWFSSFSSTHGSEGVTRLLYDENWIKAQNALQEKLEDLDFKVEFDEIGNMMARIEGTEEPSKVIATGSHIDTVVNGGRLDGQFGIIAGYLAINHLVKKYGRPKKTLEVLIFAEEEGSRFPYAFWGSKNMFGLAKREEVEGTTDSEGLLFEEEMRKAGFDFKKDDSSSRTDLEAFIELHIEQGITLERENLDLAIVNSIVGQKRFTVTLRGQSNHAGTTKMDYRKDTVHAFTEFANKAYSKVLEIGNPLVFTIGHVSPSPNTVNVIPGETTFMIDTRHTDQKILDDFEIFIRETLEEVADKFEMELDIDLWMDAPPVLMDKTLVDNLYKNGKELGYELIEMHSGAGHDSQIVAPMVPTAMVFTPSIDGVSHNPKEDTDVEYLLKAINLLVKTLYDFAY